MVYLRWCVNRSYTKEHKLHQMCLLLCFDAHSFFLFLLHWGYTVIFTKVHHSWILPFSHSPFLPLPPFLDSFNGSHFSIFTHEYIIFLLHSATLTLSLYPPSFYWYSLNLTLMISWKVSFD
jgi:hypothetical protein